MQNTPRYIFTKKNAYKLVWDRVKAYSYSSEADLDTASVIVFELENTNHGKIKSTISDRIYYVIEGKGKFIIDGKAIPVKKTDVVIIPKNTPYDYQGKLKVFLVHVPAWNPKGEKLLEKKKGREQI